MMGLINMVSHGRDNTQTTVITIIVSVISFEEFSYGSLRCSDSGINYDQF